MHKQVVMDRTGDTVHEFDPAFALSVKEAMERFDELVKNQGMTAATRNSDGTSQITRNFDPTATETLFIPRLAGG